MKFLSLLLIPFMLISSSYGQDLFKERIRKIAPNKTSIYVEKGIFHNGRVTLSSTLQGLRQSYNPNQGYERIVIDFSTKSVPRIYGHISSDDRKLYLDIFETNLSKNLKTISSTRFIEKINFFPIESNHLSIDMKLKGKVVMDIFTLENPGRLVIDLKN